MDDTSSWGHLGGTWGHCLGEDLATLVGGKLGRIALAKSLVSRVFILFNLQTQDIQGDLETLLRVHLGILVKGVSSNPCYGNPSTVQKSKDFFCTSSPTNKVHSWHWLQPLLCHDHLFLLNLAFFLRVDSNLVAIHLIEKMRESKMRFLQPEFVPQTQVLGQPVSCEKAPCTDLQSDPTLIKISTELCRQTRTSTTHTKHKRSACSRKPNYTRSLSCQENCFTLDSHMLTSDSFFPLQMQHDQSQGNTNTTNKPKESGKNQDKEQCVPSVGLSYVKLSDTAALIH